MEPGTAFREAHVLISLCMEAVELKIPDEKVCKQQYGCRITVDAGPPRVSMGSSLFFFSISGVEVTLRYFSFISSSHKWNLNVPLMFLKSC